MCVSVQVSLNMFTTVVRDQLLNRGNKIDVYVASSKGGWVKGKSASPGNLSSFESLLFGQGNESEESSVLASIRLAAGGAVALAYADSTQRSLGVAEVEDTDAFVNTEAFLLQVGAKECLLPMGATGEYKRLKAVLERCGVVVTERKATEFAEKDVEQDLKRLLKGSLHENLAELSLSKAIGSLGAAIKYLNLGADEANFGTWRLGSFSPADYMKLDHAAVGALSLFSASGRSAGTLFGLLNK